MNTNASFDDHPTETITLHFTPASVDYNRANLALKGISQRDTFVTCIIYAIFFAAMVLYLIFYQDSVSSTQRTIVISLAGIALFGILIGIPLQHRKRFRDNPQLTMQSTWEINDQGLTITNALAQVHHNWRSFREARETREYFFLIDAVDPKQYLFLNKKVFESEQEMEAFRAALRRRVTLQAEKKR